MEYNIYDFNNNIFENDNESNILISPKNNILKKYRRNNMAKS